MYFELIVLPVSLFVFGKLFIYFEPCFLILFTFFYDWNHFLISVTLQVEYIIYGLKYFLHFFTLIKYHFDKEMWKKYKIW